AADCTASPSVIVEPLVTAITFATDADALEVAGFRRGRRGCGDRRCGGPQAPRARGFGSGRAARPAPRPAGRDLTRGRRQPGRSQRRARPVTDAEHRETLGMPDVLDEYPVPGPRSMDGVLGFAVTGLGEAEVIGEAPVSDAVRQRFGLVHGGTY